MIAPSRRLIVSVLLLACVSVMVDLWSLCSGTVPLSPGQVLAAFTGDAPRGIALVVNEWRLPRVLMALLIGGALGVSGAIFQSLMRRQNDKIDPIRSKFGQIEQEEVSLDEKMMDLRTYAQEHATFRFSELMREQKGKIQMIVTFLAVLELMKTGELTVVQEHLFDDMLITSQL